MFLRLRNIGKKRSQEAPPADPGPEPLEFSDLIEELGELGRLEPPASSRERSLARLMGEVEERRARGAYGPRHAQRGPSLRGRLALGTAALLVAGALGLVGLYGLGGSSDEVVQSPTTSSSPGTSSTTKTPSLPPGTSTTRTTDDSTGSTRPQETSTTEAPPTTTKTTKATTLSPPTTKPGPPSTSPPSTSAPRLTAEERESSARRAAFDLGNKVIQGDLAGTGKLVTGRGAPGLAQLVATLEEPFGITVLSVTAREGGARALVEFLDQHPDGQGGLIETSPRFYFDVLVDETGARIDAIYKAPS